MTDITIVISERDANTLGPALAKVANDQTHTLTHCEREAINSLRWYLAEGRDTNTMRELIAQYS